MPRLQPQHEKELIEKKEQLSSDYRTFFATDSGIRIFEDLSKRCFLNHTTYKDYDVNSMVFNEGKRAVLLHIQTMMGKKNKERR